ncbi:Serine/threonine-protein kinase KIN4 [Ceratocystis fimbriata CBS 114723]|uniref:non-specific serine/threonine protein kinase n=1 Tax=Ceratocystis fimbriata CBS 114723 TaxID=1035309 RepID=A0A2C5X1P4_9PEZI|nr:Serine/threonine-protein kinase KIN4 [Ceratocystis fimbriata CBS 114723]
MASRTAVASPVTLPATASPDCNYQPSSARRSAGPPVAPPRSSSTNHNGSDASASYRETDPNRYAQGVNDPSSQSQSQTSRARRSTQQDPPARSSSYGSQQPQSQAPAPSPAQSQPPAQPQSQHYTSRQQQHPQASSPVKNAVEQPHSHPSHNDTSIQTGQRVHEPLLSADQLVLDAAAPQATSKAHPEEHNSEQRRNGRSGGRNAGASSKRDKHTKFNDYILGNVIGEGEFGKVRLGWKQNCSNQVAIKIIKKESLGNNPARLSKIHREVNILRGLQHNNIVRLYDMISDDSRIGIVLEYASGGELFDYILRHRYLKDNNAKRLFAQLVSGVGYLHKKGIVHRDLKLENLLLDRNKNIIITDFGFANTFDADDILSEKEEEQLGDREVIKRSGLDQIKSNGHRRGDLMQTSCGSPCYAAPELVVSDCLYTGRKVDVWSCGVILYAMLAGYLPFDDDPANPEGDNINLLYKYIVNTTLTFPEYVSPHARDLLRRILVSDPRKRADLFEVARHSWLSDYESAVAWITSNTTSPAEVQEASKTVEEDVPGLGRSASVRESSKKSQPPPVVGGLSHKGNADVESLDSSTATSKAAKRRTVQVEYVAPSTQTQRERIEYTGGSSTPKTAPSAAVAAASRSATGRVSMDAAHEKPLPKEPVSTSRDPNYRSSRVSVHGSAPVTRHAHNRSSASEAMYTTIPASARPHTRTGYGQPAPPAVAGTNVHGKIQQPLATSDSVESATRPGVPSKVAMVTGYGTNGQPPVAAAVSSAHRGHKRSNTIGEISSKLIGRSGSIFGKNRKRNDTQGEKNNRKYPPISMSSQMMHDEMGPGRPSTESNRRSISFGLGKKRSGSISGSQHSGGRSRRFSLISPFKAMGIGRSQAAQTDSSPTSPSDAESSNMLSTQDADEHRQANPHIHSHKPTASTGVPSSYSSGNTPADAQWRPNAIPQYVQNETMLHTGSESSLDQPGMKRPNSMNHYPVQYGEPGDQDRHRMVSSRASNTRGVLQKPKRGFNDAYDDEVNGSGAARRVMDFFRRRGKAREAAGER